MYLDESRAGPDTTVSELETLVRTGRSSARPRLTRWPRTLPARVARRAVQPPVLGLLNAVAPIEAEGGERLEEIEAPALFVANHTSHLDTPAVLRALPRHWRGRVAVAAAADYFFSKPLVGGAVALVFNAFPFSRRASIRPTLEHCARLVESGWSILLFPEGTRSTTGRMGRFKSGVGLIAMELGVPVVPVYVDGLAEVLPKHAKIPRRRRVRVRIGRPVRLPKGMPYEAAAARIEDELRATGGEP